MFLKGETSVISVEVRIRQGVTDYYINNKPQKKEKLKELRRVLKIDLNKIELLISSVRLHKSVFVSLKSQLVENPLSFSVAGMIPSSIHIPNLSIYNSSSVQTKMKSPVKNRK